MRVFKVGLEAEEKEAFAECGKAIRHNKLVAFPTETVYGLGANGLSKQALLNLFSAKQRPLNDPVILHVSTNEDAFKLWNLSDREARVILRLQQHFWPGPCTLVARARSHVPHEATASTGFVAARMPAHPVARRLIEHAKCPIAGPSANLFGRITPTKAAHVKKYFSDSAITLLECDDCCGVGIESTIVKVTENGGITTAKILRHGAVTASMVSAALMDILNSLVEMNPARRPIIAGVKDNCECPGQLLRHYSPTMHTCLLLANNCASIELCGAKPMPRSKLSTVILLDVVNEFGHLKEAVLSYHLVSRSSDVREICKHLFNALHRAEAEAENRFDNCELILLGVNDNLVLGDIEGLRGVYDRLFRAASGEVVFVV
eukprot:Gregarina_sp_Poly_1__1072@NODE_1262_length_4582_cov_113_342193_g857_i0_p2_GENE_NODE_1262_length_4582_cov_113_342193_g857_i0NODE_1262_length_4582_cov_113_342193_g857_i0_p2_ORF_typecomplete_len376_score33_08Sua5_yciO_yrdC/PF01300_18/2_1e46SUA5/PF03481_13/3_7e11_NODE_1262_length_4582_cov_113_342193_g857_i025223649